MTEVVTLNAQQPILTASLGINSEGTGEQFSRELDLDDAMNKIRNFSIIYSDINYFIT